MELYHVVRAQWVSMGNINTAQRNWRTSLKLTPQIAVACNEIAALYERCGSTLLAVVQAAIDAGNGAQQARNEPTGRITPNDMERLGQAVRVSGIQQWTSDDGLRIRETIFERIRRARHPDRLSRLDSVFAFINLKDAREYVEECRRAGDAGRANSIICTLRSEAADVSIEYDKNLIDAVENEMQFHEVCELITRYFSGDFTTNPVIEILLQGRVPFGRIVDSETGD